MKTFKEKIGETSLQSLEALDLKILQVNIGYRCNLACKHCHVSGSPGRREVMDVMTAGQVIRVLTENPFETLDITGGAPELNPSLRTMIREARNAEKCVTVRTNLTVFFEERLESYPEWYREQSVDLIASLPFYLEEGVDRVRGTGTYKKSIEALKILNGLGYGTDSTGPSLSLVYNPQGMYLAPTQCTLEAEYRRELQERFGIAFTRLYTLSNMPIGRFREYLVRTGNFDKYMDKLAAAFNPATLSGIMCRHIVSVGWDGTLYDCDFNQALGHATMAGALKKIDDFDYAALVNRSISVDDHCYGCTAGQGSS
ncbi:MAG TPA: arsenosugar biosynthesis radical SAM (seleno)protein ArsS [Nitrospirota bacterium]|nr:arsenosugar biosynthesis radical SAM (seleno)protein ArsS [Nitrospirota bacterium]